MMKINMKKLTVKKLILIISVLLLISAAVTYYFTAVRKYRPIYIGNLSKYEDLSSEDISNLNKGKDVIGYYNRENPGMPSSVNGVFTTRKIFTGKDAVKAAASVRTLLGIEEFSFSCFETDKDAYAYDTFYLQQFYKGVIVYDGVMEVRVQTWLASSEEKTNKPLSVRSKCKYGIDMDVKPKISAAKAKKSITLEKGERFLNPINAWRLRNIDVMYSAKGANRFVPNLMIKGSPSKGDPSKTEYRLVWAFAVVDFYGEWYVFVDANTGEVVGGRGPIKVGVIVG